MLQKRNKKTKYFLLLIEQFLFPDSKTRDCDFSLESCEGWGEVCDNSKENILDDQG